MADLLRSAKSGNSWTLNDLDSYHITLNQARPSESRLRRCYLVGQELLTNVDARTMQQYYLAELLTYLELAVMPERDETAVVDFAVSLLKTLGYVRRERVDFPLLRKDRCLLEHREPVNAPAQLVAEAVAAFNENNAQREAIGFPPLAEKVMPGIVMVCTSPVFFKIPVTQNLSRHIRHGMYPPEETRVTYCYPPDPCPARWRSEGMMPLDNRSEILTCYEAFKAIVGI
ncbi:hypothetical protein IW262DRAFT_1468432 [Armillaria fumosa]|nr:hypothetical protein IW262DRAFT_1468432 [Armillaria fumosa]